MNIAYETMAINRPFIHWILRIQTHTFLMRIVLIIYCVWRRQYLCQFVFGHFMTIGVFLDCFVRMQNQTKSNIYFVNDIFHFESELNANGFAFSKRLHHILKTFIYSFFFFFVGFDFQVEAKKWNKVSLHWHAACCKQFSPMKKCINLQLKYR